MRRNRKIVISIIVVFLVIFLTNCINSKVMAESIFDDPNLKTVNQGVSGDSETGIAGAINTIIGLLQIAGTGISLIMISLLGIKYILASVEEKAEIKKTAMPIVIGAVLLFGAVNLISIIENIANSTLN